MTTEHLVDITVTSLSSPEPEAQRGRKRRRDVVEAHASRPRMQSNESSTLRGRCRYRSISRYKDVSTLSRPTSKHRLLIPGHHRDTSDSPSLSCRNLLRILQLAETRHRSQSPSRSRSPRAAHADDTIVPDTPKRRRKRTRSRSRKHTSMSVSFSGPYEPHSSRDSRLGSYYIRPTGVERGPGDQARPRAGVTSNEPKEHS